MNEDEGHPKPHSFQLFIDLSSWDLPVLFLQFNSFVGVLKFMEDQKMGKYSAKIVTLLVIYTEVRISATIESIRLSQPEHLPK